MVALANDGVPATDLVEAAVRWVNDVMPAGWSAQRAQRQIPGADGRRPGLTASVINVQASNGTGMFAVEARSSVSPRDAELLLAGLSRTLRSFANVPVLVVAPWLSPGTRELLRAEQINDLDLTGNASVRMEDPALFVSTEGAARNPEPAERNAAGLRGAKAGRLIRAEQHALLLHVDGVDGPHVPSRSGRGPSFPRASRHRAVAGALGWAHTATGRPADLRRHSWIRAR